MKQQSTKHRQGADHLQTLRESLAKCVSRHTDGVEQLPTAIRDLTFYRREAPTQPTNCMLEPSVAFIIQGAKRVLLGNDTYPHDMGRFLITSLDLPTMMQIVDASPEKPYLGLALKLDLRVMAELMEQSGLAPPRGQPTCRGMVLGETSLPLLDAFKRLVELLDEPDTIPVVAPLIQREIFFRLLVSDQGMRLRQIVMMGSQSQRIAKAINWLKLHYTHPLSIDELAASVQMSASSFHHHFRELTAMTPLQFQKWLRLNEARWLMFSEKIDASTAAFHVGYESPTQFSREYSRLFGAPPLRDIKRMNFAGVKHIHPTHQSGRMGRGENVDDHDSGKYQANS